MKKLFLLPILLLSLISTALLTACGDSGQTADEAYIDEASRVGYDMGIADECSKDGVRTEPMPSAYDDSLGDGVLNSAFQSGYWAARGETQPCRFPK